MFEIAVIKCHYIISDEDLGFRKDNKYGDCSANINYKIYDLTSSTNAQWSYSRITQKNITEQFSQNFQSHTTMVYLNWIYNKVQSMPYHLHFLTSLTLFSNSPFLSRLCRPQVWLKDFSAQGNRSLSYTVLVSVSQSSW